MKKILFLLTILCLGLCACSEDPSDEFDGYLRCDNCKKVLTTNYYVCPNKHNICPSCITYSGSTAFRRKKMCPRCGSTWW